MTSKSHTELARTNQVVLVKCGGGWGSGVVVSSDKSVIVTCGHVVKFSTDIPGIL